MPIKHETIEVKLPLPVLEQLQMVAAAAGMKVDSVLKLALAIETLRWQHDKWLRTERDCAMDTLRKIASGKRRTREQRLALSCVTFLDECSNVPPNDQIQRAP